MKKITILFLFISSFSLINAQSSDIDSVKALKVDRNILTLSQSTKDRFDSNGLTFYINQYYNLSDWNNDGLGDLVIMIGFNEAVNDDDYLALFLQKKTDQKIEFIEDPNYLMSIQGHIEDFNSSVGDLNGDNLLDIVVPTHNYHGPEGKQPSYYLGKNETTDKLFINTGTGLTRFELDTTTIHQNQNNGGVPEHMPTSGITVLDWDFDGKLEILVSDQAYRRIREVSNPVKDKLFSSFEIDANNNITREFVFDLDFPLGIPESDSKYIHTRMHFLSVINDTLYLLHYKRKGWDIENLIFVDENIQNPNNQEIIWHADAKVLVIDMKKSFGKEGLIKEIILESTHKGGDLIYQDGFHPSDIDNDGKVEFLAMYWYESKFKQVPFIKIYDDDGTDVTDKWLGDKYMETSLKGGGNGLQMGDFNNDGFIDFTPKDGWRYNAQTHSPPKVEGGNGTFAIFLNDGEKFNQYNVDFTDFDQSSNDSGLNYGGGSQIKRYPVDFDNDGYYEFMIIKDQINPPPNIDIVTVNYKNNIEDISDVSIKEDSIKVIKLSAADLKGDAISYSAKSSEDNVSAVISNDTLTLTPALNWHGDAQVTAYASGSSWKWKDSTTFKLTVTPANDIPKPFFWNTVKSDSIAITKDNLNSTYDLDWTESVDVDGDTINYIVYAKIGEYRSEEIFDTTATNYFIPYQEIAEGAFEGLPGNTATVYFSVWAHDGTDSVKISRDDRVLYVNRYDYLSIESEGIPNEFALHENYPNPFNPTTQIRFDLPVMGNATLTIYNMIGQKIRTFTMQSAPAGYHSLTWNATNDLGAPVAAGVYLYQLQTDGFIKTKKMVLLK